MATPGTVISLKYRYFYVFGFLFRKLKRENLLFPLLGRSLALWSGWPVQGNRENHFRVNSVNGTFQLPIFLWFSFIFLQSKDLSSSDTEK